MKRLVIGLVLAMSFIACKKIVKKIGEDALESALVKIVTNGRWKVLVYSDGTTNFASDFNVYEFQFNTNSTVDAIKNNTVEVTGAWADDITNMAIFANYPSTSSATLQRLNGTWKLKDSNTTWLKAQQTINGQLVTLELQKK